MRLSERPLGHRIRNVRIAPVVQILRPVPTIPIAPILTARKARDTTSVARQLAVSADTHRIRLSARRASRSLSPAPEGRETETPKHGFEA
jgi:hypothetical protein